MELSRLVATSQQVAATRSRLRKTAHLAACLRAAQADEVRLAVDYLSGTLPQGRIGLGPALLRDLLAGIEAPGEGALTLEAVDSCFQAVADTVGAGSRQRRL
ncbi:MAG: ATP-dependent DNA ligase, partial [Pseudomonadota bacterium]